MAVIKRVRLSEIAELVTKGTTPTTLGYEFQDTGVNFLKIECFSEKGDYIQNKATHISEECHEKLKRSQLKEGDILFSIAGVIGRVAIVTRNMLPANINQALAIIRIKKDDIYLPYVKLILTSPLIKKQFERKKQGVAQLNISLKDINDLEIPLPEIGKQIEYANSFKKVEKLIYTRQYQLQKLDELVKARFVEMFGDPEFNTFGWDTEELGTLCDVGSSKRIYQNEQSQEGIPFWRISDLISKMDIGVADSGLFIPEERYVELKNAGLVPTTGDILVTSRGTLGRCYIIKDEDKFYFQDGMISWLSSYVDGITPLYLQYLFTMPGFRKQIDGMQAGSTVAYLSIAMLKKLRVMVPPIETQNCFALFVEQLDKSKVAVQKSLDEAQLLFDSLMQQYFG